MPGHDPPVRSEVVHESRRTRVTRHFLAGRAVIRKQPLGPDAERRARYEMGILERLRGVAGVAQLAPAPRYWGSVVLEDAGHASLAGEAKPLAADALLGLAVGLGLAVAGMHRRGVMHRDIAPANIVLAADGTPCLVDFAQASSLAEIRLECTHPAEIAGSLAYLAPEATGRSGRPADQRADLYALGATLYELATGAPPFGSGDPRQLIHDHLARAAVPPARVNPAVPEPLSAVIMHLLEKEPDNRYQSADGLVYDLLAQARQRYLSWSAAAKVAQLDWAYPGPRTLTEAPAGDNGLAFTPAAITTGTIDLLGIVSASRALSSETSIGRLYARVVEVLSAVAGASGVQLLLWSEDRDGWLLPAPGRDGSTALAGDTDHDRAVPISVLRFVRRTREPLVVADAVRDDRFARDPHFAGADCCSLLAVPVVGRDTLRAVLLLENRLLRGAFTAERTEAVKIIAGQLAVSLDNAQLYAEFGQIAGEQAALRRVATLVARAAPPEDVFTAVTHEAGQLLRVDYTVLSRYDPDGLVTVVGALAAVDPGRPLPLGLRLSREGHNVHAMVFGTGESARIDDYDAASGDWADTARAWDFRASVGVPIRVEGRLWGVMSAGSRSDPLPAGTEERLAGFTELVATAIASAQARAELQGFAEEQAALRRVATLVARAAPPTEVLATITREAGQLLGAAVTILSRYDPDGMATTVGVWSAAGVLPFAIGTRTALGGRNVTTLVFQTGRPARIDDYSGVSGLAAAQAHAASIRAAVGVPVMVEGRLWGIMLATSTGDPPPAGTEARLAGFTELAAAAVANTEAQAEVAASRARIVAAADQARHRIERDLHDGAQQRLVSLALQLRAAQAAVPRELAAHLDGAVADAASALEELREIARGIHPAVLAERGLTPALKTLARRSPIPVDLQVRIKRRPAEPVEVSAYYVVAEALTNVAKHARASVASVRVESLGDVLLLAVTDDGAGGARFSGGTGLTGLKDRVEALGGRIVLSSPLGGGTSLRAELPLTRGPVM